MEESSTLKTYLIGKSEQNKPSTIDGKRKQEYFAQINKDHDSKKPKTNELFLYSDLGNSNLHQLANVASEADPLHVCVYEQNYPSYESIDSSPNHSADISLNYLLQLNAQNSGTVFIQMENCYNTASFLPFCRECYKNIKASKYICRFYMFRKILEIKSQLSVWGFSDRHLDPTKEDIDLWKRSQKDETPKLDKESVDYLLNCIASQFCEMSQEESETENIAEANEKKNPIEKTNMYQEERFMSWKRSVLGIREMCDVCETSIFNLHWTCRCCGLYVCIDCFAERKNSIIKLKSDFKIERDQRDNYFWYKCTDIANPIHSTKEMMLTQIITCDTLQFLTENLHKLCEQWQITQKCGCSLKTSSCLKRESKNDQLIKSSNLVFDLNTSSSKVVKSRPHLRRLSLSEVKSLYSKVKHTWSCHGRLLKILEVNETEDCYKIFQDQWEQGKPVIISNITDKMNKSLWKPKYFIEHFGRKQNHLINCKTGVTIKKMPMRHFWEGFEKIEKRLPLGKTEKYVLKLKDWPTSEDFAELIQEHFDDLMNALPLKDYTHRNGKYNLASFLPTHFVRPDLGPKMYSAYSQTQPFSKGSTNLHLDVSDAVNVMVYVSKPVDSFLAETQYSDHVIRAAIRDSGTNDDIQDLPGAIWHIFPASGADCIRQLLTTVAKENGKPLGRNDDPIHDQSFYLDAELRKRLRKEYKVEGYTIIQYEGDAVFIPAGAPHQVVNLLDCVKIAEDFVSPENIEQCFLLTQEFRALSNRHTNHEDKLQIKNILYHTVKTIVSEFGSIISNDSNDL